MKRFLLWLMASVFATCSSAQPGNMARVIDPVSEWKRIESVVSDPSISADWRDAKGHSAAYYQLIYGSEKGAEELILRSRHRGAWMEGDNDRLLEIAIRLHSQRVVAALIKHGEPVSLMGPSGVLPIQLAAAAGQLEIVRMLVKAGADPDCRECASQSPIEVALKNGHWQTVLLMHDLGANLLKYQTRKLQRELVFRAIDGKSLPSLIMLENFGFNLTMENASGVTPLEYALATYAPDEIIEDLIMREKDFCSKNSHGKRTLDVAQSLQNSDAPPLAHWIQIIRTETLKCDRNTSSSLQ